MTNSGFDFGKRIVHKEVKTPRTVQGISTALVSGGITPRLGSRALGLLRCTSCVVGEGVFRHLPDLRFIIISCVQCSLITNKLFLGELLMLYNTSHLQEEKVNPGSSAAHLNL